MSVITEIHGKLHVLTNKSKGREQQVSVMEEFRLILLLVIGKVVFPSAITKIVF